VGRGWLGKAIGAAFTSVIAPVLVGLSLQNFRVPDAAPAPVPPPVGVAPSRRTPERAALPVRVLAAVKGKFAGWGGRR